MKRVVVRPPLQEARPVSKVQLSYRDWKLARKRREILDRMMRSVGSTGGLHGRTR